MYHPSKSSSYGLSAGWIVVFIICMAVYVAEITILALYVKKKYNNENSDDSYVSSSILQLSNYLIIVFLFFNWTNRLTYIVFL